MSERISKKIGFPYPEHPIPQNQLLHDLALTRVAQEMEKDDSPEEIYYRYYYAFDEFKTLFRELEDRQMIELPIKKSIKP